MPTPIPTTTVQSTSLYYREGSSDKEYHAAIEPKGDDGYIVTFAYGRRGSTLTTGSKTTAPVPLAEATRVFDKLVASKVAKGYRPSGTPARVYQQNGTEGADTGIRCQLLNPIDENELNRLLSDSRHCLQQKHDGRRLLVRKRNHEIIGINRRGLVVSLPGPIHEAVSAIGRDLLIDGEAVGDTLHAFDILEFGGTDLRSVDYLSRYHCLLALFGDSLPGINVVATTVDPSDKRRMFENCRDTRREGVVLKDREAPFSPGRPNSGGPQLKYKFVETASFVVTGHNAKRSVTLGLHSGEGDGEGDKLVPAGNVTIPPNHAIPQLGTVSEIRYLYAYRESGSIYQPVYVGPRDDIPAGECTTDQLKYKAEPNETTAA